MLSTPVTLPRRLDLAWTGRSGRRSRNTGGTRIPAVSGAGLRRIGCVGLGPSDSKKGLRRHGFVEAYIQGGASPTLTLCRALPGYGERRTKKRHKTLALHSASSRVRCVEETGFT